MLFAQQQASITLFFGRDSSNISQQEYEKLANFVSKLEGAIIQDVKISAYCDDRSSHNYNRTLSNKRAVSIKNQLVDLGIEHRFISKMVGHGELPLDHSTDKSIQDQRAFNRRTVVEVAYKKEKTKLADFEKIEPIVDSIKETKKVLNDVNLLEHASVGDKMVLSNILFIPGRSDLQAKSYYALAKLKSSLKDNEKINILILGHVCCIPPGTDGKDMVTGKMNLSIARARKVYDYLVENGIDSGRLSYKGLKADYPTGREQKYDRRVEIEIVK